MYAAHARSNMWMISECLIHVCSTWLKYILIKRWIRSYYSVSDWSWKTVVIFGNLDLLLSCHFIIAWSDGGNCHQNTLGLGMNRKAVSQLQIVVVCRQFTWFRTENTKIIDGHWHHHVWKTRTHKLYAETVSLCNMTNEWVYKFLISAVIFWVLTVRF